MEKVEELETLIDALTSVYHAVDQDHITPETYSDLDLVKSTVERFSQKLDDSIAETTTKQVAHHFNLPRKILDDLNNEGIIDYPYKTRDISVIRSLSLVWRKPKYIKNMLSHFPILERQKLIDEADMSPMEVYITSRVKNIMAAEEKVYIENILDELKSRHYIRNVEQSEKARRMIQLIRDRVRKTIKKHQST